MFYMHPVIGKGMIMLLLLLCQCFIFSVFIRYGTVVMALVDTLIAGICCYTYLFMDMHSTWFKHPKIMCSSLSYVHTEDSAICGYDQLDLVGMSLLFAGIILPLFFFRSFHRAFPYIYQYYGPFHAIFSQYFFTR